MISMSAAQIAAAIGGQVVAGDPEMRAEAISIDSRQSAQGTCFFAIVGPNNDGHAFVGSAVAAGAAIVVVTDPGRTAGLAGTAAVQTRDTTTALQTLAQWLRAQLDPTVVAITGSLGKTTTKELTATLLALRWDVQATAGNLNNHWGLPLSLLSIEDHHEVMVAELAMSHAGEIDALTALCRPDIGLITNIAPVHMENFADLDAVADAKGELAAGLGPDATLIVNADDLLAAAIPARLAPHVAHVVTFGRHDGADIAAHNVVSTGLGWRFDLRIGAHTAPVELHLAGPAGLYGFLGAAAIATILEVPIEAIAAKAPQLEALANRGAVRRIEGLTLLDESYNASPVSMKAALDTLAEIPADGRRIAVLGDMLEMGNWSEQVHRDVGAHAAARGIDVLITVGEYANLIAGGATAAGFDDEAIHTFDSAEVAAGWLPARLQVGDALLVKGSRGVHLERVVDAVAAIPATPRGAQEG